MEVTYSWIIFSCLIVGSGVLCDRKIERRQTESSCSVNNDDKFYCSNELCIEWSSVCDGYNDCPYASDEIKDMCARYDYGTNMAMDCGRLSIKNQLLSEKDNKEVIFGTPPWHVFIYKLEDSKYVRQCGGSIIAPNVVISAARCFWIKDLPISMNESLFKIGVGKFNGSKYDTDINKIFTQIINVKKIYLNEAYTGLFDANIAVIVLANKVSFSNGLAAPVCIDWNSKFNVINGDQGKVVVWDLYAKEKNLFLELNSSYISSIICQKLYPFFFSNTVTYDKFCGARTADEKYDIASLPGAGISFLYSNSYFLTGVMFRTARYGINETETDGFTDIRYYIDWIRGLVNKHVAMNSCVLPTVEGVIYTYEGSNETLSHGTLIDQHLYVIENCEVGYHKAYPSFRFCQGKGKWLSNSEKLCSKMCPPLISDSLDIKCSHNGEYANCSHSSLPGTKATPTCKPIYSAPSGQERIPLELLCQSNGKWNKQLYTCNPYCGRVYIKNNALINIGTKALFGTAPWNVGIYRFNKKISNYDMICGGSIIASNLVVSAAHCFWQEGLVSKTMLIDDGLYKIAVGKYERNFTTIDNEFTKIFNVDIVYVKEGYYGHTGFYFEDIAVLVLQTRVSFNNGVAPVCMDWNSRYNVVNGDKGKIVGWGKTENGSSSPILLEATLPYIDHSSCRNMYKNGFQSFVTNDKFCAGSALGQGVDRGDSGAGLSYLHSDSYFLTGVVSTKDPDTKNSVATFTDIKYHIQWIRGLYTKHNLD